MIFHFLVSMLAVLKSNFLKIAVKFEDLILLSSKFGKKFGLASLGIFLNNLIKYF